MKQDKLLTIPYIIETYQLNSSSINCLIGDIHHFLFLCLIKLIKFKIKRMPLDISIHMHMATQKHVQSGYIL